MSHEIDATNMKDVENKFLDRQAKYVKKSPLEAHINLHLPNILSYQTVF